MNIIRILIIQDESDLKAAFSDSNPCRAKNGDCLCIDHSITLTSDLVIDSSVTFYCKKGSEILELNGFKLITNGKHKVRFITY